MYAFQSNSNTVFKHRIGLYVRVASFAQDGPERAARDQIAALERAVGVQKIGEVVDFYMDLGASGIRWERPELQRLLADIRRKRITRLIVVDLARLSRNPVDLRRMLEIANAQGCEIQSLHEGVIPMEGV